MIQVVEEQYRLMKYKKLYYDAEDIEVFFLTEPAFVTCVVLYDADVNPGSPLSYHKDQAEKIKWRFMDAGLDQVHLITILFTRQIQQGLLRARGDDLCWLVDKSIGRLILTEDSVENFYGMRDMLTAVVARPDAPLRYTEPPLEYEPGGKLCYRSIGQRPYINHGLLILNLLGFALCILFPRAMYEWGDLRYRLVLDGQWYRMITSVFLHADATHLTGNMLMLLLIGDQAERALGHLKYAIAYFIGGMLADCTSMYISYLSGNDIGSIGASGAIFAVVGMTAYIIIRNNGRLETLTTKKMLFLIAYTLYFGFTSTGVDNAAHVGGLIAGFLLGVLLYHKKKVKRKGGNNP